VAPNIVYHLVVQRYDVTNKYLTVENGDFLTSGRTWAELTLIAGRYRALIQTKSCGQYMGPWSEDIQFSVDGGPERDNPTPNSSDIIGSQVQESAEGTKVFPNSVDSLIDSVGAVWTFGSEVIPGIYQVLQGGAYTGGGGSVLKYHNHLVYHLGSDGNWYFWNGSGFSGVGPIEP
jgi:hypothetical protein